MSDSGQKWHDFSGHGRAGETEGRRQEQGVPGAKLWRVGRFLRKRLGGRVLDEADARQRAAISATWRRFPLATAVMLRFLGKIWPSAPVKGRASGGL